MHEQVQSSVPGIIGISHARRMRPEGSWLQIHTEKILIVDDDDTYRRSLSKVFEKAGFNVSVAVNALNAFELLTQNQYALVLVDVPKPYQGGLEMLQTLLSKCGASRVIVLTTFGEKSLLEQVSAKGVSECLIKPLKRNDILDAVDRTLHKDDSQK